MKFTIISVLTIASLSMGGPLQECTETDVCSSIVFNQLALVEFKDALKELVNNSTTNLLKAAEEIRLTNINLRKSFAKTDVKANSKDLEKCEKELDDLDQQIATLKSEITSQADDAFEADLRILQQEKDALVEQTGALEAEMLALEENSTRQKEELWNLTKTVYNKPVDCADIQVLGNSQSGLYTIYPFGTENPVEVLCDMESDGGAWTVFMKRQPQDEPLDFNGPWKDFKVGFGNKSAEFWMGNDLLHEMTSKYPSMLRIDAEDFDANNKFGKWSTFSVGNEDNKYKLTVEGYYNTSTMGDSISESTGSFFTTFDQDNDGKSEFNCATGGTIFPLLGDGAWWYNSECSSTRPTAPLLNTNAWNSAFYKQWTEGVTELTSLKNIALKFRRSNYEMLATLDTQFLKVC